MCMAQSKQRQVVCLKIGLIGAGKVGFSMGKYLIERGVEVSGYYSSRSESAKEAAIFTKTRYYESIKAIVEASDTLFLTVPDGKIREVYSEIIQTDIKDKCLVHLSGALSSEVFSGIHERGAKGFSIHPICAVSDKLTGYRDLSKAYFTIEGNDAETFVELFCSLGNHVEVISAEHKVKYHAAAVFASNLMVGLYDFATGMLKDCGLSQEFSKDALLPLFLGNAENIKEHGGVQALTGPVERADEATVRKHLETLTKEERDVYCLLSQRLVEIAKQKNPDRNYEAVRWLLERKEE